MPHILYCEIEKIFFTGIQTCTGIPPKNGSLRLSRRGTLSLNTFVRADAVEAAKKLNAGKNLFQWHGVPILDNAYTECGWILLSLSPVFFTELCDTAAQLPDMGDDSYVSVRLRMLARKSPTACPDNPCVHEALLRCLFAMKKNCFSPQDERGILTMTHCKRGMERLALENSCGTAAQAMLGMRSAVLCSHKIKESQQLKESLIYSE